MYNQASSLPVSSVEPNGQYWIQNLSSPLPFPMPFQVPQQLQQTQYGIAVSLVEALQNNSRRNPLRCFLYNQMSSNGYQNAEFAGFLKHVLEFFILLTSRNMSPDQAGATAVNESCAMMAAIYAKRFPQLCSQLDHGALSEIDQRVNQFNNLRAEIDNLNRGQQYPQQNNYGGGWNQQPRMDQVGGGWNQPNQGFNQQGGYTNINPSVNMGVSGNQNNHSIFQETTHSVRGSGGKAPGFRLGKKKHQAVEESFGTTDYQDHRSANRLVEDYQRRKGQSMDELVRSHHDSIVERNVPNPFEDEEITMPPVSEKKGPYDEIHIDSNKVVYPAHKSDYIKDFTIEQPYSVAIDPLKEMRFHVVEHTDEGTFVSEIVKPYSEDGQMDYLQHELQQTLRSSSPLLNSKGKVAPNWNLLNSVSTMPEKDEDGSYDEEEVKDIIETERPLVIPDVINAFSINQAQMLKTTFVLKKEMPLVINDIPYEYNARIMKGFQLSDRSLSDAERKYVYDSLMLTIDSKSIDDFMTKMKDNQGEFSWELWDYINRHATEKLNLCLNVCMGIHWTIDNFFEDWPQLENTFIEEYGEESGVSLYLAFETQVAKHIIGGGLGLLRGEALNECLLEGWFKNFGDVLEKYYVILVENHNICHVPWYSTDISLIFDGNGGVVLESKMPELYSALRSLIVRSQEPCMEVKRILIITRDGLGIEVHRGFLGNKYIIIRKVNIN